MISKQQLLESLAHLRFTIEQQDFEQCKAAQDDFNNKVTLFCEQHLEQEHAFISEVLSEFQAVIALAENAKEDAAKEVLEQRKSSKSVAAYKKHL